MWIKIGLIGGALVLAGCAHTKAPSYPLETKIPPKTYITPELGAIGRVEIVNAQGRFVVLSFRPGQVPPPGQHWSVWHLGLKVGRVTITGPQHDIDTVADIVEGEAQVGDQAKPE